MHKNLVRLLPGLLLVLGAPNDVFAGDPCSPPEVSPAVLQPDACRSAPNHCLADSRGLTSGYVPDRLIPLETKFPKDILTLSHPGRGPEEYKVTSKGAVYKMNPRGGGYGSYGGGFDN